MIHVETRVRVGEIANIIWRRLGSRIKCLVGDSDGDDDFELTQHDFDNNHHDKATISVAINGDVIVICSVHVIKIVISVLGPDKIDIEISYRVGRKATGSIAECVRHKHATRMLGSATDADVARDVLAKLTHMLTRDVEVLLNPHKAFDSRFDSSHTDVEASAEPRVARQDADYLRKPLIKAVQDLKGHTVNGVTVALTSGLTYKHTDKQVVLGVLVTREGHVEDFDLLADVDGALTLEHPLFKEPTRRVKFDPTDLKTLAPSLRRLLEDLHQ